MFKANILAMINSRFFIDESTRGKFWRKMTRYYNLLFLWIINCYANF